MNHLEMRYSLAQLEVACLKTQVTIDEARERFPFDGSWQLELDRAQTTLNEKRASIAHIQIFMPAMN